MKTIIAFIFFISILSFSQKITADKVPAPVRQAFMKEFPKAMEPAWRADNDTYQVMFTLNGNRNAAKFDKEGAWIDKEQRIGLGDLPKEVTASIAKNFPGFKAYEAEKVEARTKGLMYNVGLEKEKEYKETHFSQNGEVLDQISKTTKSEWGKDND
jgi:hypothetical protein